MAGRRSPRPPAHRGELARLFLLRRFSGLGLRFHRRWTCSGCRIRLANPPPLEVRNYVFDDFGRLALAAQSGAETVFAGRQIRLGGIEHLILAAQQTRQIGLQTLLHVEELIARLAELRAQAGVFPLRDKTRDAVEAGENGVDRRVLSGRPSNCPRQPSSALICCRRASSVSPKEARAVPEIFQRSGCTSVSRSLMRYSASQSRCSNSLTCEASIMPSGAAEGGVRTAEGGAWLVSTFSVSTGAAGGEDACCAAPAGHHELNTRTMSNLKAILISNLEEGLGGRGAGASAVPTFLGEIALTKF